MNLENVILSPLVTEKAQNLQEIGSSQGKRMIKYSFRIHPSANKNLGDFPKFNNPYGIKTPPGYSCLFIQPLHRESRFTIFPGIVDTDTYTSQVNFPFILNDENWEGIIPAGTPMAQVIPFKRESWTHSFGSEKEIKEERLVSQKRKSMFINAYKKHFWNRKSYN
jgi:hypothetical protein